MTEPMTPDMPHPPALYFYECFYKGKRATVRAGTALTAQSLAAAEFKAKRSYDVTVVLAAEPDGTPTRHVAD